MTRPPHMTSSPPAGNNSVSTEPKTPGIDVAKLPTEQGVAKLISYSLVLPASDVFFSEEASSLTVSVRHLGIVSPISVVSKELGRKFISHIKAVTGMDLSEKRRPQDGRWLCN